MKLHPADIAKEIKEFSFFKSFSENLLLQLATMVDVIEFQPGEYILKEGQTNTKLFFIKHGSADVLLAGEVVTTLKTPGEVIGEMSVATEKPVSTSIRAGTSIACYVLDSENFKHVHPKDKDRFLALLYKLYSVVLSERLVKTNEKARLFEIANRELYQAQMNLEKTGQKSVLVLESDKKQLLLAKLAVGGTGVDLDTASSPAEAEGLLASKKYDAILVDEKEVQFLQDSFQKKIQSQLVLMASKDISKNFDIYKKCIFADSIITKDPEDRTFTIRTILTTLTKILSRDLFGFEKYLSWGVDTQIKNVISSRQRDDLKQEMVAYFKKLGIRNTILDKCVAVTEELLMNAIYDAPVDSHGKPLFNHLMRKNQIDLDTSMHAKLKYGSDGVLLAISVTDPFGSLTKEVIIRYLDNCYSGQDNENSNQNKGGAGRGLHQIIENSDLTIFNVKKGVKTEVICLFNVEAHKQEAKPSFHYFFS